MPAKRERKFVIEVLMEAPGGDLVFQPIKASKSDLKQLIEATKNPVISENIKWRAKEKKVKL